MYYKHLAIAQCVCSEMVKLRNNEFYKKCGLKIGDFLEVNEYINDYTTHKTLKTEINDDLFLIKLKTCNDDFIIVNQMDIIRIGVNGINFIQDEYDMFGYNTYCSLYDPRNDLFMKPDYYYLDYGHYDTK